MLTRAEIVAVITEVATEQSKPIATLTDDLNLLDTGLDSLCFAIIVARLEDLMGFDPFGEEQHKFPTTLGEFIKIYEVPVT
jgi:acyl carrier protein